MRKLAQIALVYLVKNFEQDLLYSFHILENIDLTSLSRFSFYERLLDNPCKNRRK